MYDLKALQNKEIEILQAVHDACDKLGIRYFIMYGTLLGAVRHKGFIPWDDDIDICMTREDYDVFVEKGQQYLPENLKIQHYSTEVECPNIYAKVRDCNTTFLHREHIDLDINHGIFIDVFPMDRIKSSKWGMSCEYYKRQLYMLMNSCCDKAYIDSIIRRTSKVIGYVIHYGINKLFVRPTRAEFTRREDERRRILDKRGDNCVFITYNPLNKTTVPYDVFEKRALYEINGKWFYGPEDYNTILKTVYGNYMQLPPESKRITHKPLFVDFEHGYTKNEINSLDLTQ